MDENDNVSKIDQLGSLLSDGLSHIDGIPLPPAIKKNLLKSVGRLITGLVDVPVALLDAKVQQIKSKSDGLSLVTKKSAELAAEEFGKDQGLIDRSVNFYASRLLKDQINRENVVNKTIQELKSSESKEDSNKEIDSDWLESFSRIAETKSNEDVQLFLSKILAGEIKRPGSFSSRTLHVLSTLDQSIAKIFESFCNISFEIDNIPLFTCVLCEPIGQPGNNDLEPMGLSYLNLARLQDAGLIQHDMTAYRTIPAQVFGLPFKIGNKSFQLKPTDQTPSFPLDGGKNIPRINCLNFTSVGEELRKILVLSYNQEYNDKFILWAKNKYKLTD